MLDRERLDQLLDAVLRDLEGDWLLVGGALASLWLESRRVTEDVDMVGLEGTQAERLRLMQFAESQGLAVETVNSAVDYYLRKIAGWRDELVVFRQSERVRIFRPSPTLFLLLKLGRLSEQDLDDCVALLDRVDREGLELDRGRVVQALRDQSSGDESAASRRLWLLDRLL